MSSGTQERAGRGREKARTARWEPAILGQGDFDFEPDWHNVDTATVDLAAALAKNDGNLAGHLDMAWTWALELIDRKPDTDDSENPFDGLNRAISWLLIGALNEEDGYALDVIIDGLRGDTAALVSAANEMASPARRKILT